MAICEIIKGAEKRHGTIWTVVDDRQLVTRFFLVWPPGTKTDAAARVNSTTDCFLSEVQASIKWFE